MKNILLILMTSFFAQLCIGQNQNNIPHNNTDTVKSKNSVNPFTEAVTSNNRNDYPDFEIPSGSPWEAVASSGTKEIWYIFNRYISKDNGQIKIWIKADLPSDTYNKIVYKNVELKQLVVFDCQNDKFKTTLAILYNSKGNVIYNQPFYEDFEDIAPETVMSVILESVCKKYR